MVLERVPRWTSACGVWAGLCAGGCACGLVPDSSKYPCAVIDAQAANGAGGEAQSPDAGVSEEACGRGQDRPSLENACTTAACVPYVAALPSCEGGLCPLPPAPSVADAG